MHLKTDTSANSHFARVPTISHSRNAFTISEKHVTTIQFDKLFPLYWKTIYPGDTLSATQKILARLQTQNGVLYDDLYVDSHAWFVPMRLIQTDWARYQFNAQPLGPSQDNSSLTSPSVNLTTLGSGGFASKSLYDYLGYPTLVNLTSSGQHITNYAPRAYNLIWNENYRDQNLQAAITVNLDNGADNPNDYTLRYRGKRHDKLTSGLTAQQKGAPVTIPLGTSAPVYGNPLNELVASPYDGNLFQALKQGGGNYVANLQQLNTQDMRLNAVTGSNDAYAISLASKGQYDAALGTGARVSPPYADLTAATAASINLFRTSVAVQHLLEADARGGTRDVEAIQNRWGVTVPDFRMQRPEYLGGTTWTFDGHVVPQTSETGTTPQGTLTQFSQSISSFNINHSFVEHGIFMILTSARSNITYQQGLQKDLSYRTRFDWYQPEFANLGEVAVKNKEIFMQGTSDDDETFSFQEYAYELRYGDNRVSSEMRSNYPQSLDSRHMADDYSSLPTLSAGWIQSNTPISRNIVVDTSVADPIEMNTIVEGRIARTLPMYSIPGLMRL